MPVSSSTVSQSSIASGRKQMVEVPVDDPGRMPRMAPTRRSRDEG